VDSAKKTVLSYGSFREEQHLHGQHQRCRQAMLDLLVDADETSYAGTDGRPTPT
jgi:hypothetical protein